MLVVLYCTVVLIAFRLVISIYRNLLASKDMKLFMCLLVGPLIYKNRALHIASVCYSFIVIIYHIYIVSTTSSIPSLLSRRHRCCTCCGCSIITLSSTYNQSNMYIIRTTLYHHLSLPPSLSLSLPLSPYLLWFPHVLVADIMFLDVLNALLDECCVHIYILIAHKMSTKSNSCTCLLTHPHFSTYSIVQNTHHLHRLCCYGHRYGFCMHIRPISTHLHVSPQTSLNKTIDFRFTIRKWHYFYKERLQGLIEDGWWGSVEYTYAHIV